MERRFDAIVLIPVAIIVGLALGLQFSANHIPIEMISQAISMAVGAWIAIIVIEMLVRMITDGVLNVLNRESEFEDEAIGYKGELSVLLVRGDEVVGQIKSWDQIKDPKRRGVLTNKLRRLLTRQTLKTTGGADGS